MLPSRRRWAAGAVGRAVPCEGGRLLRARGHATAGSADAPAATGLRAVRRSNGSRGVGLQPGVSSWFAGSERADWLPGRAGDLRAKPLMSVASVASTESHQNRKQHQDTFRSMAISDRKQATSHRGFPLCVPPPKPKSAEIGGLPPTRRISALPATSRHRVGMTPTPS